jgi:POT family proton-dependent oligopeptide transporter
MTPGAEQGTEPFSAAAEEAQHASNEKFLKRAVLRLSTIEFWERYSYYNMWTLLPLFAAAAVAEGGMGWSNGDSLRFFGVYLLTTSLAPLLGGYISDQWLGGERALKLGAFGLLAGHSMFALAAIVPWITEQLSGVPMRELLASEQVVMGGWSRPENLPEGLLLPYLAISVCFYGAVALVALGGGLFKPVLTVVVGRLPHPDMAARNRAFTTFFLFLNIGGLMSTLLGGLLAQAFGWGWAFGAAAAGMGIARLLMSVYGRRYIRPYVSAEPEANTKDLEQPPREDWSFLRPIGLLLLIYTFTTLIGYQSYGFINLFTADLVDRNIFGFLVPPSWFVALNPITIMVLTPVVLWLWRREGLGYNWTVSNKFAAGFVLMTAAFACISAGSLQASEAGLASPIWAILGIILIASNELLTTPAGWTTITRLTPAKRQNVAVGAWSAAAGIGGWFSGRVGALAMEADMTRVLLGIMAASALCALLLFVYRKPLARIGL